MSQVDRKEVPPADHSDQSRVATDAVVFCIDRDQVLVALIQMIKQPYTGMWAAPGGLIKVSESADESAKKQVSKKLGIHLTNAYIEQFYAFGRQDRDRLARAISVGYIMLLPYKAHLHTTEQYSDVRWFPVNNLPPLAYDHDRIISKAYEHLQTRMKYSTIVKGLLPTEFTLSELQNAYEVVMQKNFEKRNFRKKFAKLNLLESTGRRQKGVPNRPAELFYFKSDRPEIINIFSFSA